MCIFKAIWWDLRTKHYVSVTLVKIGPSSLFVIEGDRKINGPKVWVTNFNLHRSPGGRRPATKQLWSDSGWLQSLSNKLMKVCKHAATNQSQSVQLLCDVSRDAKRSQANSRQTLPNCYFTAVVKHQLQLTHSGSQTCSASLKQTCCYSSLHIHYYMVAIIFVCAAVWNTVFPPVISIKEAIC